MISPPKDLYMEGKASSGTYCFRSEGEAKSLVWEWKIGRDDYQRMHMTTGQGHWRPGTEAKRRPACKGYLWPEGKVLRSRNKMSIPIYDIASRNWTVPITTARMRLDEGCEGTDIQGSGFVRGFYSESRCAKPIPILPGLQAHQVSCMDCLNCPTGCGGRLCKVGNDIRGTTCTSTLST